ncbi:hypothetical protein CCR75_000421 [Bremia lactucae]|uniref:Uncharacterized protein n=1 Tax=Bremia lactucae TaxID=4779 RepID=A0A976FIU0_BRELC|nr:hypothetical protein CCR75_000426 [Bremia lactucae]TDH67443.1 hypothetical protein CCR75_000421 [Bremia lactucae]
MLAAGIIRPSKSPFSSPSFRIFHEFQAINARVRMLATPIPRKETIYDAVEKGRWFSALDLLWGFFQVRLRESNIPYTAFSTSDGLFEYLVTPMSPPLQPCGFKSPNPVRVQ